MSPCSAYLGAKVLREDAYKVVSVQVDACGRLGSNGVLVMRRLTLRSGLRPR